MQAGTRRNTGIRRAPPLRPRTARRRQGVERLAYRARELAEALGVHERTVWRWIAEGRLTPVKVGGATLIPADQVAQRVHGAAPQPSRASDPEVDRVARAMLR